MANPYYNVSGTPGQGAPGASSPIRAEFAAIAAGMDKLPVLAAHSLQLVRVNSGATALETVAAIDAIPIGSTTPSSGAFTTLSSSALATLASLAVTAAAVFNGSVTIGDAAGDALTVNPSAVSWPGNPTHSGNHTFSGNVTINGSSTHNGAVTLGDAPGDALTVNSSAVTWAGNPTHSGTHTFSGQINSSAPTLGYQQSVSGAGVTLRLNVLNMSNTANSACAITLATAGSSAGDPFIVLSTTATDWSFGVDNSVASDPFVLSASGSLGTSDLLSVSTAGVILPGTNNTQPLGSSGVRWSNVFSTLGNFSGAVTISGALTLDGGDLSITRSAPGATINMVLSNTSNTASAQARQIITVAGATAGDAFTIYSTNVTDWAIGVDNSDADAFAISPSGALGTSNALRLATTGAATFGSTVSSTGFSGPLTGNASTATALQTPRLINAVSFDGTADITVTAAAGTLTGATLNAGVTASSLTSVGTLTGLTVSGTVTLSGTGTRLSQSTSNNGGDNQWTLANTSNTAASQAAHLIQVAGGTAGDAFTRYSVSGVTEWALGVDNSDSDSFVLAASSVLGTTNRLRITTAGAMDGITSLVMAGALSGVTTLSMSGDFTESASSSGANITHTIANTSNTANSQAVLLLQVAGGTAGDAFTRYSVNGVTEWAVGVDNSVSDAYVISASNALGSSNVLTITTTGIVNVIASLNVGTTLDVTGAVTLNGNVTLGDAAADNITFTGTPAGQVFGGTYTPTITNVTNVAASAARLCTYIRIGSIVTVYGSVQIDPTSGSTLTEVGVSLPIASNFTVITDLSGIVVETTTALVYPAGSIQADPTNDRADLFFQANTDATAKECQFTFQYIIK